MYPTSYPTPEPTDHPTPEPTGHPTHEPTFPTFYPTVQTPTVSFPTIENTPEPTPNPTPNPTIQMPTVDDRNNPWIIDKNIDDIDMCACGRFSLDTDVYKNKKKRNVGYYADPKLPLERIPFSDSVPLNINNEKLDRGYEYVYKYDRVINYSSPFYIIIIGFMVFNVVLWLFRV
eukprot:991342_1